MRKKKRSIWPWLLVGAILIGAAAWGFYSATPQHGSEKKTGAQTNQTQKPEKTTEPMNKNDVDYRQQSEQVHQKLDQSLANAGFGASLQGQEEKRSNRGNGGAIIWNRRTLAVETPAGQSAAAAAAKIKSGLAAPARVLEESKDTWAGKSALRLDIGFEDQLGGDPLRLITEKIYIIGAGVAAVSGKGAPAGRLAIVIDDCGYDLNAADKMTALPANLTFAVLPYRTYSEQSLAFAQQRGKEAILHLPMEPIDASQTSEATTVSVAMSSDEIQRITSQALASLPGVIGVNNHQGSRATSDERTMRAVLGVLRSRGLFFVDSHTYSQTVAYDTAVSMGVPTAMNTMFMDNSSDVGAIKGKMRQAAEYAADNGSILVICHARPNTATALSEVLGELQQTTNLVFASQLLR